QPERGRDPAAGRPDLPPRPAGWRRHRLDHRDPRRPVLRFQRVLARPVPRHGGPPTRRARDGAAARPDRRPDGRQPRPCPAGAAGSVGGSGAGGGSGSGVGQNLGAGIPGTIIINGTITSIALPPASAGNLFVADLGTGLSVPVAVPNTTPAVTIRFPVQGPEI